MLTTHFGDKRRIFFGDKWRTLFLHLNAYYVIQMYFFLFLLIILVCLSICTVFSFRFLIKTARKYKRKSQIRDSDVIVRLLQDSWNRETFSGSSTMPLWPTAWLREKQDANTHFGRVFWGNSSHHVRLCLKKTAIETKKVDTAAKKETTAIKKTYCSKADDGSHHQLCWIIRIGIRKGQLVLSI